MNQSLKPYTGNSSALSAQDLSVAYMASSTRISRLVILGLLCVMFFVGGSIYWSLTKKLDGAVVAPASFVVEGNRKTVQHLEGGIVSELLIKEGDVVEANQTLLRLDSTDTDVNLTVLGSQFSELVLRRARLTAELQDDDSFPPVRIDPEISKRLDEKSFLAAYQTQKRLFDTQRIARQSEEEIMQQRVESLNQEIEGLENQRGANQNQLTIARRELGALQKLLKQGYTSESRVNVVKREIERLRGQDASFKTSQARARNQIGELQLTALSEQKNRQERATAELAATQAQLATVEPQYLGVVQRQKRVDVKAPVSGKIVNLNIYTQGGVIRPGEDILDIVPADEALVVAARVSPTDIEKLRIGQETRVRLTAFDQTNVPEAQGIILDLSADSIRDERSGAEYFVAKVQLNEEQSADVGELKFVPGMPADIFVNTGERTAISYLLQPLSNRLSRTFIE
ncbi:MAG: HlyD family type I secretion periplasmic adaptor subunit [Hyphomicrobiales bacterium]